MTIEPAASICSAALNRAAMSAAVPTANDGGSIDRDGAGIVDISCAIHRHNSAAGDDRRDLGAGAVWCSDDAGNAASCERLIAID